MQFFFLVLLTKQNGMKPEHQSMLQAAGLVVILFSCGRVWIRLESVYWLEEWP